ncbi:uncharacterized protein RMCT_1363 [Mycolicibacterium thermoresistibile]|uniref:Uncharacterized protein n=1 Tax=Mycolicibacterium thermoresistibile TaxID=1797 RepID=A0A117ILY1_MYCTH|nr:uncharacterized protein RMCT_1363 [Mycolicibacterium thermoresistibile]
MNTTPASRKPITDGIELMPTIKMVRGIQNHTRAIAAPVTIDAVGTTPRRAVRVGAGAGAVSAVTATMLST